MIIQARLLLLPGHGVCMVRAFSVPTCRVLRTAWHRRSTAGSPHSRQVTVFALPSFLAPSNGQHCCRNDQSDPNLDCSTHSMPNGFPGPDMIRCCRLSGRAIQSTSCSVCTGRRLLQPTCKGNAAPHEASRPWPSFSLDSRRGNYVAALCRSGCPRVV